jgi:hypothetical protein
MRLVRQPELATLVKIVIIVSIAVNKEGLVLYVGNILSCSYEIVIKYSRS